jgi:hypothetical protein
MLGCFNDRVPPAIWRPCFLRADSPTDIGKRRAIDSTAPSATAVSRDLYTVDRPLALHDIEMPVVTRPKGGLNVTGHAHALMPCGFIVWKLLAILITIGPLTINVKEVVWHSDRTEPARNVSGQ